MAKFQIEVEEILQRVVDVEAASLEEAIDKVDEQYNSEEIVLDYEDLKKTEIREYDDIPVQYNQENNNDNIQKQINNLKKQIRMCNSNELEKLINKYIVFNEIKNSVKEKYIDNKQCLKMLHEDSDILNKIYDEFRRLNINWEKPVFDEFMLGEILEDISIENEEELDL